MKIETSQFKFHKLSLYCLSMDMFPGIWLVFLLNILKILKLGRYSVSGTKMLAIIQKLWNAGLHPASEA